MFSIVEIEIFGFLPFPNWPDFGPKIVKNRSFWASNGPKLGFIELFGLSTKSLET